MMQRDRATSSSTSQGTAAKAWQGPRLRAGLALGLLAALLVVASGPASAAITVASSSNAVGERAQSTTLTWSHTVPAGSSRDLLVGVSFSSASGVTPRVASVTYGGTNLVITGRTSATGGGGVRRNIEIWAWDISTYGQPTVGTANVVVTLNAFGAGNAGVVAGAVSLVNVDQTTPLGSFASATSTGSTTPAVTVAAVAGQLVFDTMATGGTRTATVGAGQTQLWNAVSAATPADPPDVRGCASTKPGAAVSMSWTLDASSRWAIGAVLANWAAVNVATTMSGSPFLIPVGQNVTYTISLTNNDTIDATNVMLTDPIPAGLTYQSATPSQGSCSYSAPTVTCTLGTLNHAKASAATVTIVAQGASAGTWVSTVTVDADQYIAQNTASASTVVQSQVCMTPGKDGAGGTLSGVVNTYYPGTASASAGSTSITLGQSRGATTPIAANDMLLVIQMQDADFNYTSNDSNYGGNNGTGAGLTDIRSAGRYEYVQATSAVPLTGGTVTIAGAGAGGGLLFDYHNDVATAAHGQRRFQVIRVPQYTTATLGSATAAAWTTTTTAPIGLGTGGILAVDVAGGLDVTSTTANVNGLGFRGGGGRQLTGGAGANTDYRTASTVANNGAKGEGIAGTPEWIYDASTNTVVTTAQPSDGYPSGSQARGAPANAGGGSTDGNPAANDQNSGGGGGSNGGKGGKGGYSWSSILDTGGTGAAVTPPPSIVEVAMGGGGGAGTRNNSATVASSAAAGGGIILIRAGQITGIGTVEANGADVSVTTDNDGGGGGGAGGSIVVIVTTGDLSGLTLHARGGRGGDDWFGHVDGTPGEFTPGGTNNRHGPGGGGGGGGILYSTTAAGPTTDVSGGAHGLTCGGGPPAPSGPWAFGSTNGDPGIVATTDYRWVPGDSSGAECVPDPAVTKSHVGDFTEGSTATFTLHVSNVAPRKPTASPGTITVTDTLPTTPIPLTPTAASGTGWSGPSGTPAAPNCQISGQTVTCWRNDSLAAGASFPDITVTVQVGTPGPDQDVNTATLSATGTNADFNALNDTSSDPVVILGPTLARVPEMRAFRVGQNVLVQWCTDFEVRNLGFRVYREEGGHLEQITPSLVAGSALFAGQGRPLPGGRPYRWVDRNPGRGDDPRYWLEDVDLNGTATWHGPFGLSADGGAEGGRCGFRPVGEERESALLDGLGSTPPAPRAIPWAEAHPAAQRPSPEAQHEQWELAAGPAAKTAVSQEGWYRVTQEELVAAGFDPGTDPALLQVFAEGEQQPIVVHDGGDGSFDPGDWVELYGMGLDTSWTAARVYWLVRGSVPGVRVTLAEATPPGPSVLHSFPFTVERRDRTVYFAVLTSNGDRDNFYGPVLSSTPVDLQLDLPHVDLAAIQDAELEVALQGATLVGHVVDVQLNGHEAGTVRFFGEENPSAAFSVPHTWLLEGENVLTLVAGGGEEDYSLVDVVRLTYQHLLAADDGALKLALQEAGGSAVTITGFPDDTVRVFDVTDPLAVTELPVSIKGSRGDVAATVVAPLAESSTLLALSAARVQSPDGIVPNQPSSWNAQSNRANLVVLAHPTLLDAAGPLVQQRQNDGLTVAVVDVTDVYDEFSFGEKTPQAIRDFLTRATQRWQLPPHFVLLLGDATFDPRNYLGFGDFDRIPTRLVPTTELKTASDDWLVDFNDNDLPDMAIGRLPARTDAEAQIMVAKVVSQGVTGSPVPAGVLLVADGNDEFNFEAAVKRLAELVPGGRPTTRLATGDMTPETARGAIVSGFESGPALVVWAGHGSQQAWSDRDLFDSSDALALTNGSRLPFVVSLTCLNGLFQDVYGGCLAEAFLQAGDGGAAAVWASSALTEPRPQTAMAEALLRILFRLDAPRIGQAVLQAKTAASDRDVRRSWIFFGDPSMRVR